MARRHRWVDTYVTVGRSRLDSRVWVPNIPDDDGESFEYAGAFRTVKAWVLAEQIAAWAKNAHPKTEQDFIWEAVDERSFKLLVNDPEVANG